MEDALASVSVVSIRTVVKVVAVSVLVILYLPRDSDCACDEDRKKIWLIAVGNNWGSQEYLDDKGIARGFNHDLVAEVCAAAGIDCRMVWDKYQNCVNSKESKHMLGGKGLMSRWYDACTGFATTPNRLQIFDFSRPFLNPAKAHFVVRYDDNSFNPQDITGKKITFTLGFSINEDCLARRSDIKGSVLPKEDIIHAQDDDEFVQNIMDGKVAAGWHSPNLKKYIDAKKIKLIPQYYYCAVAGHSMITMKDTKFIPLWNYGFMKLFSSGRFKKLCEESNVKHGHRGYTDCVTS